MQLPDWPIFTADEIDLVRAVLESGQVNYWTGTQGKSFEREYAEYCGVDFAVAVANGSLGLDAALKALGLGKGDEVIVTPRSFVASASSIVLANATPVFVEIDRNSQNITAASIRAALSVKTKAIICVHHAGWPCDMPEIMDIAKEHRLAVIEDCAQAHGARIAGKAVGTWGDVGVFSFCQDKILTTGGEGGMLVTNRRDLWEKLWSYKDHGKSYAAVHGGDPASGFRWLHKSFGTNLRMTEMQAALGRWQLKRLDESVTKRRRNAKILQQSFADLPCVRVAEPTVNIYHSYYKYYVFVQPEQLKKSWNRDRILTEFVSREIPGLSGSCPAIYLEDAFTSYATTKYPHLPVARELGETSIVFEVHPTLNKEHINHVANVAKDVFSSASL